MLVLYQTASVTACGHAGIHAFFGAFIAGVIVPKEGDLHEKLAPKIELVVRKSANNPFLLPFQPEGAVCFVCRRAAAAAVLCQQWYQDEHWSPQHNQILV